MRQAGRTLPEYRALRAKHDFLTVMRNPDLAAEVTLQPIRRFGMDAAVVFSDILIIPEAMGQTLAFGPAGPVLSPALPAEVTLRDVDPATDFAHLGETLRRVRDALGDGHALLGFAGAPFTIACYMVNRGGKRGFPGIGKWRITDPNAFDSLMKLLATQIAKTLVYQLENGADAVQLFDTWAGELSAPAYAKHVAPAVKSIITDVQNAGGKVIYYLRNGAHLMDTATQLGADGLSVDWRTDLPDLARRIDTSGPPSCALQGNIDPLELFGPTSQITQQVTELHTAMRGRPGHIFNLGHGLPPDTPLSGIEAFVTAVQGLG